MPRLTVLILILITIQAPVQAQLPPDKALSTFQVPAGMQLQLFASEPMFANPTSMDVDERGRVWVCESVNYRWKLLKKKAPNRPEGDRIVILEDTDGDGKADKATTFYQSPDFLAPLGIAVAKNASGPGYKVYVCHSPHLYLFEDKDGDGKADGPPEILLTGFNGIDHDHGIHGIHFGPDGKLYFSVGDQGVKNLFSANGKNKEPKPGEKVWSTNRTDCQAGTMWRCNTDGTNLELLAHNFRNQYEPAVNSFGTMFTSDNDDDGNQQTRICHVMYGGNYGYWPRNRGDHHWHEDQPGVVHKTLRTGFGSPTGMCWYEGKLLHKAFNDQLKAVSSQLSALSKTNQSPNRAPLSPGGRGAGGEGDKSATNSYEGYLLHTDAGPREVRLFGVRPKGAGYELDKVNLVTSTDNWFRPSDVCVAPDGSIMIADWYDPGVGGHGMGDTTRGRIYRLTTKESPKYLVKPMNLVGESVLDSLHSPCLASRQTAMNTLKDLNINKWIKWVWHSDNHMSLPVRGAEPIKMARDMWAICQHKEFAEVYPQASVLDCIWAFRRDKQYADAHYRGICFEATFWSQLMISYTDQMSIVLKKLGTTTEELERGFEKDSSVINRVFLVAMRNCKVEDIKECFYKLATAYDGQDRTYLSALNIALGTDPQRRAAILDVFEKHFPEWNDKTAWLVWELQPPRVVAKLGQKLANEKLTSLQTELALGAMSASSGTDGGESLLKLVSDSNVNRTVRTAALKTILIHIHGKWNSLKKSDLVRQAVEGLQTDRELLPAVIELVTACERKDFQGMLENFAYNNGNISTTVRYAAIQGLGKFKNEQSVTALKKLLNPTESPEIRQQVIQALGTIANDNALSLLKEMLKNPKTADFERTQSLQSLASSRAGTSWLLAARNNNDLPADLVAETGRLLRSSPYQDLRNKAMLAFPIKSKINLSKLPSSNELAKQIGSADRGKLLVSNHKDLACSKCHSIQGDGGKIGPDLSMIGIKGSKENLFDSILTPDKAIADQYVQYTIETKNGVVMTGLVVEETADYLVLRDANGKDTKLAVREMEQRSKSVKSIMPDNLASYLSEDELIDVVAYLATLKTPALSIDKWNVLGPFPSDENAATLKKALAPEAPVDLKANYLGKRGIVEWRTSATNAQNQLDLVAIQGDEAATGLTYLYAEIDAPLAGFGEIKLGATEAFLVNFNGKHVYQSNFGPPPEGTKHSITVELNQGVNKLLIKVSTSKKPQPITCTILTPGSEAAKLK